jgi:hypothetical protein
MQYKPSSASHSQALWLAHSAMMHQQLDGCCMSAHMLLVFSGMCFISLPVM